ncbi:MAG TPA: 16S rRNA (cytidine(1402)-2'-O)-methyltransferase [bacterium]|nr:16S rRNA (cytidine(1402)-2'-O)-methyltransferase [bacterium]HPN29647.1 16S rRNA (cytidine(1402)-2'-O)-methyltransferase [bacterium]
MRDIQNQSINDSFEKSGVFYIVSTPIGNLDDMTLRAIKSLNESDLILCEDTRKTIILLNKFNITKKLFTYNDYNKFKVIPDILIRLKNGKNISLVSDAGTPAISDPGYHLIKELISHNIKVIPVPGANAAITALSASGIPSDTFMFIGFLPNNPEKIKKKLECLKNLQTTFIFYESPKRVNKTLELLYECIGDKPAAVCRELTKLFEEFKRKNLKTLISESIEYKGEIVIIVDNRKIKNGIAGAELSDSEFEDEIVIDQKIIELYNSLLEYGLNKNDILRIISKSFEITKNRLYDYFNKHKPDKRENY